MFKLSLAVKTVVILSVLLRSEAFPSFHSHEVQDPRCNMTVEEGTKYYIPTEDSNSYVECFWNGWAKEKTCDTGLIFSKEVFACVLLFEQNGPNNTTGSLVKSKRDEILNATGIMEEPSNSTNNSTHKEEGNSGRMNILIPDESKEYTGNITVDNSTSIDFNSTHVIVLRDLENSTEALNVTEEMSLNKTSPDSKRDINDNNVAEITEMIKLSNFTNDADNSTTNSTDINSVDHKRDVNDKDQENNSTVVENESENNNTSNVTIVDHVNARRRRAENLVSNDDPNFPSSAQNQSEPENSTVNSNETDNSTGLNLNVVLNPFVIFFKREQDDILNATQLSLVFHNFTDDANKTVEENEHDQIMDRREFVQNLTDWVKNDTVNLNETEIIHSRIIDDNSTNCNITNSTVAAPIVQTNNDAPIDQANNDAPIWNMNMLNFLKRNLDNETDNWNSTNSTSVKRGITNAVFNCINVCANGGICDEISSKPTCICSTDFTGDFCEKKTEEQPEYQSILNNSFDLNTFIDQLVSNGSNVSAIAYANGSYLSTTTYTTYETFWAAFLQGLWAEIAGELTFLKDFDYTSFNGSNPNIGSIIQTFYIYADMVDNSLFTKIQLFQRVLNKLSLLIGQNFPNAQQDAVNFWTKWNAYVQTPEGSVVPKMNQNDFEIFVSVDTKAVSEAASQLYQSYKFFNSNQLNMVQSGQGVNMLTDFTKLEATADLIATLKSSSVKAWSKSVDYGFWYFLHSFSVVDGTSFTDLMAQPVFFVAPFDDTLDMFVNAKK